MITEITPLNNNDRLGFIFDGNINLNPLHSDNDKAVCEIFTFELPNVLKSNH